MPAGIRFPTVGLPGAAEQLRAEVREFLSCEIAAGAFSPRCDSWLGEYSPEFSRKLGERGWLGMTWPKRYGGHERSALERVVVTEELLAAVAPVASHWIADRQSGPSILRYGTEEHKRRFLLAIARGECFFSIGMSEPESGSDLASVRTGAERVYGIGRSLPSPATTRLRDRLERRENGGLVGTRPNPDATVRDAPGRGRAGEILGAGGPCRALTRGSGREVSHRGGGQVGAGDGVIVRPGDDRKTSAGDRKE
jgi:hypothetical protein